MVLPLASTQMRCRLHRTPGLLAIIATLSVAARAVAEPPGGTAAPVLRLETGLHSAPTGRADTDAKGRWLVTSGDDKTARVWDLRTGAQLRVLRPPIGDDREGQLWAVAISPDGRLVATGGPPSRLSVFERATGRLLRSIPDLPSTPSALAFSRNGRWLAVGLMGPNGVRVFETHRFALVGYDAGIGGDSYSLEFFADDRLVATSYDGLVRLYRVTRVDLAGLTVIARRASAAGLRPYAAAFSPDGAAIAVGFEDSVRIEVLDGQTLERRYEADTSGLDTGGIFAIAWSVSTGRLYAAGSAGAKGGWPRIRAWLEGGRGSFVDLLAAKCSVMGLRVLAAGDVVFSAQDPAWGRLDAAGMPKLLVSAPMVDFRGGEKTFAVSQDGATMRFGFEPHGRSPARFDLRARTLVPGADDSGLDAPVTSGVDLKLDRYAARLGARNLELEAMEEPRGFAVGPDGRFALATSWFVRVFDRAGDLVWRRPGPSWTRTVNVSGDGRLVLASYADGTIRWYRMSDGKELLALFPHADRKRWVAWTPNGYYDASPGGEDLIGWHVNRGLDHEADFFPASRFRDTFYRPDVVSRVLDTLDEAEALRVAYADAGLRAAPASSPSVLKQLPPVVEILSPGDGSSFQGSSVTVGFRVRAPADAPATELRVRVDGQAVRLPHAPEHLSRAKKGTELKVPMPSHDATVQVFAKNRHGWSAPAAVHMSWAGSVASVRKPRLYLVAVGVGNYRSDNIPVLQFAHKDAVDFATTMKRQEGRVYERVHVKLVPEGEADRAHVMKALTWLRSEVTANDVAIVFFSGHGDQDADGRYYFLPVEADPNDLLGTAIAKEDFLHTLSSLAGKTVFFMDSCRSGRLAEAGRRKGSVDLIRIVNELNGAENGVAVYASSTGRQSSLEDVAWKNGAFTKALVEGLSGSAAGRDGQITHLGLAVYLSERVKELTHGRQHPVPGIEGVNDFPIAAAP
jgi:WD40 repeat protein